MIICFEMCTYNSYKDARDYEQTKKSNTLHAQSDSGYTQHGRNIKDLSPNTHGIRKEGIRQRASKNILKNTH